MRTQTPTEHQLDRAGPFSATWKVALLALMSTFLLACKIVVVVPEGGKVVTEDGFECLAGQICIIDVSDDTFDSTFTAMPDGDHTFTRWLSRNRSFCGNQSGPCKLSTVGFDQDARLMDVLGKDLQFFLQPVFVPFDVDYWSQVLEEIAAGSFVTESFLYATPPIVEQCDPGALKGGATARALEALNQVRDLHLLPVVDYKSSFDMQMQESSLVQRANSYLNHFPAPSDTCYTAEAEEGASTSNLTGGSEPGDPANHVFGWTNDNRNLAAIMEAGHRRWILFPELGFSSYGQVDGYASLKTFSFGMPPTRPVPAGLDYVAMPHRVYPYNLVSTDPATPWSLSIVPASMMSGTFDYFSDAQVTVVDDLTGNSLPIENLHSDTIRFGLPNFLSWMVKGFTYDVPYTVTVTGIKLPGGGERDIEYPVMLDRYDLLDVDHPKESSDSKTGQTMQGNFNAAEDADSYVAKLAGQMTFTGSSEFSNQGFYIQVYDRNKRLIHSSDAPFTANFKVGKHTVVVSLCDADGNRCYPGTTTYRVTFN